MNLCVLTTFVSLWLSSVELISSGICGNVSLSLLPTNMLSGSFGILLPRCSPFKCRSSSHELESLSYATKLYFSLNFSVLSKNGEKLKFKQKIIIFNYLWCR